MTTLNGNLKTDYDIVTNGASTGRNQFNLAVSYLFESEDDYRRGDEILSAMPAGDTPGQRTSVTKYNVATRMSN